MDEFTFLLQIAAEPENRLHRQIYADWLEEQGDPACSGWRNAGAPHPVTGDPTHYPSLTSRVIALLTVDQRLSLWEHLGWSLANRGRVALSICQDARRLMGEIDAACTHYARTHGEQGSPEFRVAYRRRRTQIFVAGVAIGRVQTPPALEGVA